MDKRFFELKQLAKQSMQGRFGKALLVTLIPAIMFAIIASIVTFILNPLLGGLASYVESIITAYGTFIALCLSIPFYRGRNQVHGEEFFTFDRRLLHYFMFTIFISIISGTTLIPFYPQLQSINNATPMMLESFQYYENLFASITSLQLVSGLILLFINIYISVRLLFTTYIIVDQELTIADAMKKSWSYTRGRFWYLFFFPLSFILWFLLLIPTLFLILIYLIPYISLSYVALYDQFKIAAGDQEAPVVIEEDKEQVEKDILDDDVYI